MLDFRTLDLNRVIEGLEPLLRRLLGDDIELRIICAAEGFVRADRVQTELVILNLAINARDAMPGGGVLTIETSNAHLDATHESWEAATKTGSFVTLVVSDTGSGMDANTKAHLFEPFFTTKEFGKGTGLGLSTAYGIVQQSGGYIRVESEPARGAVFTTYWPQAEECATADPCEIPPENLSGSETILVVEDESAVRKLMCSTLRRAGYTVVEASSGAEALGLCESYPAPIQLAVSDVMMPGMSGLELANRLESIHPETKILYVSGYASKVQPSGGVRPGPFLAKPFSPRKLASKVREALFARDHKNERLA